MARYIGCAAVLVALVLTPVSMAAPVDLGVVRDAVDFLRTRHYNPQLDMPAIIRAGVPGLRRALERAGVPAQGLADIPRGSEAQAMAALEARLTETVRLARGKLSGQDLAHAAVRSMFRAVGDATVFITPREREITKAFDLGRLAGVGIRFLEVKDRWIITAVAPGGPADRAGIRRGDELLRIGPEDVHGLSPLEIRTLLLGAPGTAVQLTTRGRSGQVTRLMVRGAVSFPILEQRMLPNRIAYMKFYAFPPGAADRIHPAIAALGGEKPRGIIVDFQDAGEDLRQEHMEVMGTFFPADTPVGKIAKRDPNPELSKTWGSPVLPNLPIAVLIGRGTWGAGELMAAAFKEHANAILVGQRTPGMVVVYTTFSLRDGSLAVVVEGHILSGKGLRLHGRGLKPDVEVAEDRALERAIQAVTQKR